MPNPFGQMSLRMVSRSGNPHGGQGGMGFPPATPGIPPVLFSGLGQAVHPGHLGLASSDAFPDVQGVCAPLSDQDRLAPLVSSPLVPHQPPRADPPADTSTYFSGRKIVNNVVTRISTPYSTGPLLCPYGCGRSFKHATQKAIHVRKAHTGERPFVCSHEGCGRAFHSSGDLKSHERTHSGAREHICQTCGKALSSRNALKVHERALHTLDRPFKCEVPGCGMTYMTRLDLDRHANKHAKNKAKEEQAKLTLLEKRAAKAERQVKQLREKLGKLEKRERKTPAASAAGGGNEKALGPSGPSSFSPAEAEGALDAKSVGRLVELTPVPPPGAVAYLVLTDRDEGAPSCDRDSLDNLAVVRRRDASSAAAENPRAPEAGGGARASRGVSGATSSHLTSNSDGGAGVDPTVQGVFAARDALAGVRPPADDESEDDEPLAALARGGGGDGTRKRARPVDDSSCEVKQERGRKLTQRRVLECMLREAYEAASTCGTVPFQSWRRGLPKAEAERLAALAQAEVQAQGEK